MMNIVLGAAFGLLFVYVFLSDDNGPGPNCPEPCT